MATRLAEASLARTLFRLAAASGLLAVNAVLVAALSGLKKVETLVAASIAGTVVSAGAAALLALEFDLYGALMALPAGQALSGVVTALFFLHALQSGWRELADQRARLRAMRPHSRLTGCSRTGKLAGWPAALTPLATHAPPLSEGRRSDISCGS